MVKIALAYHKYIGIVIAWFVFVIFLFGTLSYFKDEITFYMQKDLQTAQPSEKKFEKAINLFNKKYNDYEIWTILNSKDYANYLVLRFYNLDSKRKEKMQNTIYFDPKTGENLVYSKTKGGHFFQNIHRWLYDIPNIRIHNFTIFLESLVALFLLFILISGLIIHRNIFKNFFKLNLKNKITTFLDIHFVSGISTFIFLIFMTISGIWLEYSHEIINFASSFNKNLEKNNNKSNKVNSSKYNIELNSLSSNNFLKIYENATIKLQQKRLNVSINRVKEQIVFSYLELGNKKSILYDFNGFEIVKDKSKVKSDISSVARDINSLFVSLHRVHHAPIWLRFLLFCVGIVCCILSVSGIFIFIQKRVKKSNKIKILKRINIGIIFGCISAICMFFMMSNIFPPETKNIGILGVWAFYFTWILFVFLALIVPKMTINLTILLCFLVPLINIVFHSLSMFFSNQLINIIDFTFILLAISLILLEKKYRMLK